MAYRFAQGKNIGDALHRIGEEQFDRARASLKTTSSIEAVHETRKSIKRLRALLRLVRSGIGESQFARENRRLGDIARSLSGSRDRSVLAATLAGLSATEPVFRRYHRRLAQTLAAGSENQTEFDQKRLIKSAATSLEAARKAWLDLDIGHDGLGAIETGLAQGLRDLKSAEGAATDGDAEAVHDWRKAVQRHWRHMRLMEAGWPAYFLARSGEAKLISELLGRSQDLALLIGWLGGPAAASIGKEAADQLIDIARAEQTKTQARARQQCGRLTSEGARRHARRAVELWRVAAKQPAKDREPTETAPEPAAAALRAARGARKQARVKPGKPAAGTVTRGPSGRKRPVRRKTR